jgi:hypothetical protein
LKIKTALIIVYRLSFIGYRLSVIVYRLSFIGYQQMKYKLSTAIKTTPTEPFDKLPYGKEPLPLDFPRLL